MASRKQNSAPNCKPIFLNSSDVRVDYSARTKCTIYYKMQSQNDLKDERHNVAIWYDGSVHSSWKPHLKQAIRDINTAAPGLYLYEIDYKNRANICVFGVFSGNPHCIGDITNPRGATVNLKHDWSNKKRTSIHELLHALGLAHEHQRNDSDKSLAVESTGKGTMENFRPQQDFHGITRFDPFSIMLYCEGEYKEAKVKRNGDDPVWAIVPPGEKNDTLSELDKVGLNLLYPPCRTGSYQPCKSRVTGMWYCGRYVMTRHNYPAENTTDGYCGKTNWANCPACRTLKNDKVNELVRRGKWQGWSGLFYCGKNFGKQGGGHDGYCGPNNGHPCPDCARILIPQ